MTLAIERSSQVFSSSIPSSLLFSLSMVLFRLSRKSIPVNGLRVLWILVTLWYEYGVFHYNAAQCAWPDSGLDGPTTHILLIADPQILDHRSYPDRPAFLTYISRVLVDLNLRKSWHAAIRSSRPDAVIFLGDVMDGGRAVMTDAEYAQYVQRFMGIFPLEKSIPRYFIPGNHDTGLGRSQDFSPLARTRFVSSFGPLNQHVSISNHTLALIDAPTLVEEDLQRSGRRKSYEQWTPASEGTIEFVKSLTANGHPQPAILFSHIPLSRPEGSNCGPLRERGAIHRGTGLGYQNTLSKDSSRFLLESLRPTIVFSGDDHDYCDYVHTLEDNTSVREVTVKSLSMAMGIRQPGYQLLSLVSPGDTDAKSAHSDVLCLMPDQLGIYLSIYIPLALMSIFVILISCIIRAQHYHRSTVRPSTSATISKHKTKGGFTHRKRPSRSRLVIDIDDYAYGPDDNEGEEKLPTPVSSPVAKQQPHRVSLGFFSRKRPRRMSNPRRRGEFAGEFLRDVRDVAVFPLAVIFLVSCWTLKDF